MNRMKAPKILPWIARKAGITDELALKLWRRAISEAEYLTGQAEGSEYWNLAIERARLAILPDAKRSGGESGQKGGEAGTKYETPGSTRPEGFAKGRTLGKLR